MNCKEESDSTRETEPQVLKRKLESKNEALLILSRDLQQCREERDQFKLMAEQIQERYQALKKQLVGVAPQLNFNYNNMEHQSLARLLCEMKEVNKALQLEADDLKQKLSDSQGDIKLLREQLGRHRVGTADEGLNTRHFPAYERQQLVKELEILGDKQKLLERDLQQLLDEKEECVNERDIFKNKYIRLNNELNYILKGDEKRIVDIDALVMDNKYLREKLNQMEEEKSMTQAALSKYRSMLERKKCKTARLGDPSRTAGMVLSKRQVTELLEDTNRKNNSPQLVHDLQALTSALLDTLNDKNLALQHQRKSNKILGERMTELEKKLRTLEVSGLWNVEQDQLNRMAEECEEIRTLIPIQTCDTPSEGSPVHSPEKESEADDAQKDLDANTETNDAVEGAADKIFDNQREENFSLTQPLDNF
ncbi:DgyrCDS2316 [Dimorphilus gyrociliatus]|uniref:DgyrCDS2316 n=1 Tax=Dimorphilus gyrociliatus TaxID=2664684 RepID=A0A7I8VB80_9ANNE|nr:DgyrCDS2316 [Dimorphilus gyrociliatus]